MQIIKIVCKNLLEEMTALQLAKKVLRQELKLKLKNMSKENRSRQSEIIFNKLLKNEVYANSRRVSIYLSRDIEVDTESILLDIFQSGKECYIPKYDSKTVHMEMVKLKSLDEYKNLPLTSWNIKQHSESDVDQVDALITGGLDLIIVPGIGFTKNGNRIGNGKGYYDVYLKKCKEKLGKSVPTIALSYKEQLVPFIPMGKNDIRINEVITSE